MKDSFDLKLIDLTDIKTQIAEQTKGGQTTQSTPQKKGQDIHRMLAEKIKEKNKKKNKKKNTDIVDELLKRMESELTCTFIKAEVSISGSAVKGKKVDYWSGQIDAIAIRENEVPEVFVVDWKTSEANAEVTSEWWTKATNFKRPLYQCLVYRELLQAHFKHHGVNAKVGIILVPLHQTHLETICPGLCLDFQKMDKEHLLDGLNKFEWHAVLDESSFFHTIKMPCKLIRDSFDPADYVDESTNILKDDTPLKDMLNDDATVGDLRKLLDLPLIKVESIKKEEKTNEELEEVNKKCLNYVVMTVKLSVLNKTENN